MPVRKTRREQAHDKQGDHMKAHDLRRFAGGLFGTKIRYHAVVRKHRKGNEKERAERRHEKRRQRPHKEARDADHHDVEHDIGRRYVSRSPDKPRDKQGVHEELDAHLYCEIVV